MKMHKQDVTGALSSLKEHFGWKFPPLRKPPSWYEKLWKSLKNTFSPKKPTREIDVGEAAKKITGTTTHTIDEDAKKIWSLNMDISTEEMTQELSKLNYSVEDIRDYLKDRIGMESK